MSDASLVTRSPRLREAERLVAAWLAGTQQPPADDLTVQPLQAGPENELCFCAGTFTWPTGPVIPVPAPGPVGPLGLGGPQTRTDPE